MSSARERFGAARVARLATVGEAAEGTGADTSGSGATGTAPHLVPIVFALAPDADVVYSCVDHKPKRTRRLRRLANITANPAVSLLVDHYADDWTALWWVRVDGLADVVDADTATGVAAIDLLSEKYPQYRTRRPDGPVIVVRDLVWHEWAARP
ncbi:TIGR03668 family PPOX class F420-dependent oxidoreductase [Gordonia hankookensis]|uniref:TIGR03668 family PPOX class F420-dependent oxidoreductase n=1 Tax=Gordonia hankookensis TaxID=589403 RepID=A0ABR7WI90_9ACTN|nr:TIGR03668 family PPOX class F420-dependent oxidoreductase [Gordonia hankookensis]MBD1322410.1 TIGR03668 family PPOX class F420-dependent oxidoreductase [Gordonia hankookensis]